MRLLLFLAGGIPVFIGWILYRLFIKKEKFPQVKDAFFTGIFCFAVIAAVMYMLM